LEIGPGPGTFTIEAAARAGKGFIFAVDIQPPLIRTLAHNLLKTQTTNVVPLVASAYELPFLHNTFDRVFMVCVLGEIPDKEKALCEIKRVLKEDGLLAIGEFLPDPDYPRQKTVINWCHNAGFKAVDTYKGFLHYVITFKK
jgi:ubiquinone/menaquinone biosynthesis C-methylase UbiE